jgi:hypothetical protein
MQQRLFPNIKRMTFVFCAAIVLITIVALISRLTFLSGMVPAQPAGLTAGSVAEEPVEASDADYVINSKIYFAEVGGKGNILITNRETNPNYIRVDVCLNKTGRSIYYSGDIAPGTPIESVRLQDGPEEAGVYECTAFISAYDPDTRDKVGEEEIPVTVYIGVKPPQ